MSSYQRARLSMECFEATEWKSGFVPPVTERESWNVQHVKEAVTVHGGRVTGHLTAGTVTAPMMYVVLVAMDPDIKDSLRKR